MKRFIIRDRFLWNTICDVLHGAEQEAIEEIYKVLHEKGMWTIAEIEQMYEERK
jgi:hypothetical protein